MKLMKLLALFYCFLAVPTVHSLGTFVIRPALVAIQKALTKSRSSCSAKFQINTSP